MGKKGEFNSRWGNAIADDYQYCHVPGYILRNYAKCVSLLDVINKAGEIDIKRGQIVDLDMQDMMFVIHVMAFKYDAPNGKATPGLPTIAEYSGLHVTSLRRIKKKLISYGLLTVQSEIGRPDIYNFAGLHDQCVRLEQGLSQIEGVLVTPSKSASGSKIARGWASKSARGVVANPLVEDISKGKEKSTAQKSAGKSAATPKAILDPMADAVMAQFGWKWETASKNEKSRVRGVAKQLCDIGRTPDEVPLFYAECKKRGWKGFSPNALLNVVSDVSKKAETRIIPLDIEPTDYPSTADYVNLAGGA